MSPGREAGRTDNGGKLNEAHKKSKEKVFWKADKKERIRMKQEGKTIKKTVRMTEADAGKLKAQAEERQMSEANYMRFLLSQKPTDYPEIRQLIRDLINEVNHIGVNVNQIVKNNNAEFYRREEKDRLFAYMKKMNRLLNEVVMKLGDK